MVRRRDFMSTGLVSIGALGLLSESTAIAKNAPKELIVCFREKAIDAVELNGVWHICALADPRTSQSPDYIRLLLQISTDEAFDGIILDKKYYAFRKDSYIVRATFKPDETYDELYFRFVAVDVQSDSALRRGAVQVGHSSPIKKLASSS